MMVLNDGPAKGAYAVGRAPIFLRAVVDQQGGIDVLDQLTDTPERTESVHVYERIGEPSGMTTLQMSRPGGRGRRCVTSIAAEYRYLPDVDGEAVRDFEAWRDWCLAHAPSTSIDPTTMQIVGHHG